MNSFLEWLLTFKKTFDVFAVGIKQALRINYLFCADWKNEPAAGMGNLQGMQDLKRAGCRPQRRQLLYIICLYNPQAAIINSTHARSCIRACYVKAYRGRAGLGA